VATATTFGQPERRTGGVARTLRVGRESADCDNQRPQHAPRAVTTPHWDPVSAMANPRPRFRTFDAKEEGVGGLLLLFVLTQVLGIILTLVGSRTILAAFDLSTWDTVGQAVPSYRPVVIAEAIALALRIMLPVVGLLLIWQRDRWTVVFYTGYLTFLIVWGIADHLAAKTVYTGIYAMLDKANRPSDRVRAEQTGFSMQTYQMIAYAVIWLVYWRTSDRVRRTFEPVTAPLPTPAPVGPG
jgi:hypothetical protein